MFDAFPKTRPEMPEAYRRIYEQHYKENREGRSAAANAARKVEAWVHRTIAEDLARLPGDALETLEIGAGTLNHLPFEPGVRDYDIVEPFRLLFEDSPHRARVRHIYADASEIPEGQRYDRVVSITTFEHICNLPEVVARIGLLLRPHGQLRVGIPSEGELLWKLSWMLTTGLEFRLRRKLDYGVIMAHEHVNTSREIEEILRTFFRRTELRLFGLTRQLSILQILICGEPDIATCERYLRSLEHRGAHP